MGIMQEEKII